MALVGNIDGQPVYDKIEEAVAWAKQNGLAGYHTHVVAGKIVYMGGADHSKAINVNSSTNRNNNNNRNIRRGY
tara:strand:- start:140 stop:358 length:219 start_codon:yes stop_codon:yes gene_type:complete